jgi:hypothetical protein
VYRSSRGAGSFGAHGREPVVAQDLELVRDRGLGGAELAGDDVYDLTRGVLAIGEELEDATPHRIPEDIERVHQSPVKNAMVRSACARASSGSAPDGT